MTRKASPRKIQEMLKDLQFAMHRLGSGTAATNHYSETIVNTWAEFVAIVDGHKGTHAFRGMSDAR